mgnify:CR=1 FL=1
MVESDVSSNIDLPEFGVRFSFQRRPISLPGDLRPIWRIGLLTILMTQCCRQQRSSLTRLHVLSWTIRSKENYEDMLALIAGDLSPDSLIVRFDPAVNRAIDFAIGEGLMVRVDGSRIELTALGKEFAMEIFDDANLYAIEKSLAVSLKLRVSETLVDSIFGVRR